jgi:PadR family transcriptional regulator PadR
LLIGVCITSLANSNAVYQLTETLPIMDMSSQIIKGILKTITLKVINDSDKIYGYEIIKVVKQETKNKILISEGALYPVLHVLETGGHLESEIEFVGKRVRKHYKINISGKALLRQKTLELKSFIQAIELIFNKDGQS